MLRKGETVREGEREGKGERERQTDRQRGRERGEREREREREERKKGERERGKEKGRDRQRGREERRRGGGCLSCNPQERNGPIEVSECQKVMASSRGEFSPRKCRGKRLFFSKLFP